MGKVILFCLLKQLLILIFCLLDGFTEQTSRNKVDQSIVHIRNQQRNGRKSLTTIQGLAEDLDLKKMVKIMRKMFSTNGTILKDEEMGEIIQIQGDRRKDVLNFLVKYNICTKEQIKVHGF